MGGDLAFPWKAKRPMGTLRGQRAAFDLQSRPIYVWSVPSSVPEAGRRYVDAPAVAVSPRLLRGRLRIMAYLSAGQKRARYEIRCRTSMAPVPRRLILPPPAPQGNASPRQALVLSDA